MVATAGTESGESSTSGKTVDQIDQGYIEKKTIKWIKASAEWKAEDKLAKQSHKLIRPVHFPIAK